MPNPNDPSSYLQSMDGLSEFVVGATGATMRLPRGVGAALGLMEREPPARLPPAPPDPPRDEQLKQWLDVKRGEYERFGASPEQVDQWLGLKRNEYEKFLGQRPPSGVAQIAQSTGPAGTIGQIDPGLDAVMAAAAARNGSPPSGSDPLADVMAAARTGSPRTQPPAIDPYAYQAPLAADAVSGAAPIAWPDAPVQPDGPTPLTDIPSTFEGAEQAVMEGFAGQEQAQTAIADAKAMEAKTKADTLAESQKRVDDLVAQRERRKAEYAAIERERTAEIERYTDEEANYKIDPGRLWRNAGTGKKIGMAISIAMTALGDALQRKNGPNAAVQMIHDAIRDDILLQQDERKALHGRIGLRRSLLDDHVKRGAREDEALDLAMGTELKRSAQALERTAALAASADAKARGLERAAQIRTLAGQYLGSVAQGRAKRDQEAAEFAQQRWETKQRVAQGWKGLSLQERQIEEAKKEREAQREAQLAAFNAKSEAEKRKAIQELGIDKPGENGVPLVDENGQPVLAGRSLEEAKVARALVKNTQVTIGAADSLAEEARKLGPEIIKGKAAAAFNSKIGLLQLQLSKSMGMGAYDNGSAAKLAEIVGGDPTKISKEGLARALGFGSESGEIVAANLKALADTMERGTLIQLGNPVLPVKRDRDGNVQLDERGLPERESVFVRPVNERSSVVAVKKAAKQALKVDPLEEEGISSLLPWAHNQSGATVMERSEYNEPGALKQAAIYSVRPLGGGGDEIDRRMEAAGGPTSLKYPGFAADREAPLDVLVQAARRGDPEARDRAQAVLLGMVRNDHKRRGLSSAALSLIQVHVPELYEQAIVQLPEEERGRIRAFDEVRQRNPTGIRLYEKPLPPGINADDPPELQKRLRGVPEHLRATFRHMWRG